MNCDHAAEFVSALCDGETIPSAAAEHIGSCGECQKRLREYIEMGVELRRLASIDVVVSGPAPEWKREPRTVANYWRKGWETMRIPRFAFALLVGAILVLGSSLAIIKVRARSEGSGLTGINCPVNPAVMVFTRTRLTGSVGCARTSSSNPHPEHSRT